MFGKSRFVLFVCAAGVLAAAPPAPEISRAQAAMARLPLRFEANQGQWNSAIRYAAHAGGYTVALTAKGASVAFAEGKRVDIALVNSNRAATVEPLERTAVRTDYFSGPRENWKTNVPSYDRVRYRGVYPGTDLVFYGNGSQLEYDFVLAPGADPRAIAMQFRGASHLAITSAGDLEVTADGRTIVQKKPIVYQAAADGSRQSIGGGYTLMSRNRVGIRLGHYDRTRALVIDPVVVYSSYMGGSATEQITAVTVDNRGRLYVAGWTTGSDIPVTDNAYATTNFGLTDGFVAAIDTASDGSFTLRYFSYLGGGGLDIPTAIAVDAAHFVYVTGTTTSTNFPVVGSAVQTTGAGNSVEAFVAKLDLNFGGTDSLVYSTFLGGPSGDETPRGIAVDKNSMIYLIGNTRATDFPVTAGAYQSVQWGPQDLFLSKIDTNSSSLVYSTYLGGELAEEGRAIAVAPNGLVYFAASTYSTQFPLAAASYRTVPQGHYDVIIGVMDMNKSGVDSLVYSTYFGGSDNDEVRAIAFDPKGNLVVTGYTLSADFPVTADALQGGYAGNADAFVSVVNPLDPAHFVVYSTYLGGSGAEVAYGVASDAAGNVYVTGYTMSADFPTTSNAPQTQWGNGIDIFLTKFKPGVGKPDALVYSTYFGGAGQYVPQGLALGSDGTAFVAGYAGIGLPTSDNATQGGYAGGRSDGFILAIK
jgi:hypothetical protein